MLDERPNIGNVTFSKGQASGMSELFHAADEEARLGQESLSRIAASEEGIDQRNERIFKATGVRLDNPFRNRGTYLTLRPLLEDHTLKDLSTGTRIPPRHVLRNLLHQGLLLPLLLALLSTVVLRRREWALPQNN